MFSVLVVEADDFMAKSLMESLARHGYESASASSSDAALQMCEQAHMVLLSLELPDCDGVELCRRMRDGGDVPIIALTSNTGELDRVLALQAGADDCMVKPYGMRELISRMEAVQRRRRPRAVRWNEVSRGTLQIDPASRQVRLHGHPVMMTRKEFDLLHLLASQAPAVVSRKELMSQVWDDGWGASDRTIDTHVSMLRTKLGDRSWIVTVRGIGYRLGPTASEAVPAQ